MYMDSYCDHCESICNTYECFDRQADLPPCRILSVYLVCTQPSHEYKCCELIFVVVCTSKTMYLFVYSKLVIKFKLFNIYRDI